MFRRYKRLRNLEFTRFDVAVARFLRRYGRRDAMRPLQQDRHTCAFALTLGKCGEPSTLGWSTRRLLSANNDNFSFINTLAEWRRLVTTVHDRQVSTMITKSKSRRLNS